MSQASDQNLERRSDHELQAASEHVLWEFRQRMRLARHVYDRRHEGVTEMVDPLDAGALEAFCLHSRALVEFLWRDRRLGSVRPRRDDAVAGDWFDLGTWSFEPTLPHEVAEVPRRTGWGVAHISYKRIDANEIWGWDHVEIGHRIASRFFDFAEKAPCRRLCPQFRDEALRENLDFRENMVRKEHPFEPSPNHPVGTPISTSVWLPKNA
jgi:hypothetical protein